jgi:4,5-DOPA dioxygenase extradiol
MDSMSRMPAVFIGHGSPMNTLEVNRFTAAWQALGKALPRPRAVLSISAHWLVNGTAVTAMPKPRVIHDFYGFPQRLFEFDYPAPGAPDVADEVIETVGPLHVARDVDSWGLDHGTWSVLAHVFPLADVPVVQLSIHGGRDFAYHLDLGARLAPLRERGILILGSGNVVHNLRRIDFKAPDHCEDWGQRFDSEVRRCMTTDPSRILDVVRHPDYALSVPTPEHFMPLLYVAGLCRHAGQPAEVLVDGGTFGSLTMTSYVLDMPTMAPGTPADRRNAASMPDPDAIPPENTNT